MKLGVFSISLSVKDLAVSKRFYENLGFTAAGDYSDQGWCIMTMGETKLGLFEGMFPKNTLTFNPGWDSRANALEDFDDVRTIQARLEEAGIPLAVRTPPDGDGPAHIALIDPDGNPVLIDQHVPKPAVRD